jgi:hypothetical protein
LVNCSKRTGSNPPETLLPTDEERNPPAEEARPPSDWFTSVRLEETIDEK